MKLRANLQFSRNEPDLIYIRIDDENGRKNFCTNDSSRPKAFNGKGFAFHMRRPQSSSSSSTWASLSLSEAAEAAAIASRLVLRLFEAAIAVAVVVDDMTVVAALGGGTGGFGAEVFRLFLFL